MEPPKEITYQLLTNHIQALMTEEFMQSLTLGKYSKWGQDLTPSQIIPMLSAIGQYGKLSALCPDIDTSSMFHGNGLDQLLETKLWLTQEQLEALRFLSSACRFNSDHSESTIPFEYSKESPDFAENVAWANALTRSDLFGILWHVGGFSTRTFYKHKLQDCINNYHPRAQESLICLMRVAQGQKTYYQIAGKRYPLREHNKD